MSEEVVLSPSVSFFFILLSPFSLLSFCLLLSLFSFCLLLPPFVAFCLLLSPALFSVCLLALGLAGVSH